MIVRSSKNHLKRGDILNHSKLGMLCVLSGRKRADHWEYEVAPVTIAKDPNSYDLELVQAKKVIEDLRRDILKLRQDAKEAAERAKPGLFKRLWNRG